MPDRLVLWPCMMGNMHFLNAKVEKFNTPIRTNIVQNQFRKVVIARDLCADGKELDNVHWWSDALIFTGQLLLMLF